MPSTSGAPVSRTCSMNAPTRCRIHANRCRIHDRLRRPGRCWARFPTHALWSNPRYISPNPRYIAAFAASPRIDPIPGEFSMSLRRRCYVPRLHYLQRAGAHSGVLSSLNECTFCESSHAGASRHLFDAQRETVDTVLKDFRKAPVSDKLKALLTIAGKVEEDRRLVSAKDVSDARGGCY